MSKSFDIRYYQNSTTEDDDDNYLPYPNSTSIAFEYEFSDAVTWDVILWQFCKVLEATGYEGVRERIRLIDRLGIMSQNHLFTCIDDDDFDWGAWDDTEEDEEEASEEEEDYLKRDDKYIDEISEFQDIKKEIA
jgi:hypothetical protein